MYRDVKGKKVAVIGLGRSGLSATKLLHDRGAEVTVTDVLSEEELSEQLEKLQNVNVKLQLGGNGIEAIEDADIVVVSPGIAPNAPSLALAEERKIRVISEIELFFWYCQSPIVAITGTNGKTTTATLVAELLRSLGYRTRLAGNIGIPLTELVDELDREEIVVAEISSFQLEHIEQFHPHISVLLNITCDHLDRYEDYQDYVCAKGRIFANQEEQDFAIINADDGEASRFAGCTKAAVIRYSRKSVLKEGVFVSSGTILTRWEGKENKICLTEDIKMKGAHNVENCLAAVAVGLIYDGKSSSGGDTPCNRVSAIRDVISEFPGLEHRLEYVRTIGEVSFFNDSKATNVAAVVEAVQSFDRPVVLICGGRDKRSDYSILKEAVRCRVRKVILVGEATGKLLDVFQGVVPCIERESFRSACRSAFSDALPGDVVLLSPACSSFDMFKDFEERGKIFKAEVENFWKER